MNEHKEEPIWFKAFYSDWVRLENREKAVAYARALFRRMPNKSDEERLRLINEKHFRGTQFTMDEVNVRIL